MMPEAVTIRDGQGERAVPLDAVQPGMVLIAKPGYAVTKERLFRIVFSGEEQTHVEAIEVVAHRLRKKLVGTGTTLMTLRGLGYLLREASATDDDSLDVPN